MAATVLAMSVESSVLEQAWNCLNADEAGQRAIVIPRSVATRDLLFVDKQIPRCARDDNQVSSAPCLCSVRPRPRSTVDACLENGAFAARSRNSTKKPKLAWAVSSRRRATSCACQFWHGRPAIACYQHL